MDKKLEKYLKENKIVYVLHKHLPFFNVEESKKHRKELNFKGLHCKTLFLKDDKGKYYLVGMGADRRLDIGKLEDRFNVKKLRFGSVEELKEQLGVAPGSVSIFGIFDNPKVMLILAREVWEAEIVGFHPNVNTETIEIDHENLERYYIGLENLKEIINI